MAFEKQKPRQIVCSKCGKKETEKVFGTGFFGWIKISEIVDTKIVDIPIIAEGKAKTIQQKIQFNPELCPTCNKKICDWVNNKEEKI